jgi:uncharacterized membrane protein (DUF373 family)
MWDFDKIYTKFERLVSRLIIALLAVAIVALFVVTGLNLASELRSGGNLLEGELFQNAFGSLLTILILLEFNHSIVTALARRSGIIQARIIVLLAIVVVARKLILVDFKSAKVEQFAGLAAVAVALGILYWLISSAAERFGAPELHHDDHPAPEQKTADTLPH